MTEPDLLPATLWQKIGAAMKLIGYVQKKGRNEFHNYRYVTAADVAQAAREAFNEVGLLFLPTVKSVETRDKTTSKGGLTYVSRVWMTYCIRSIEAHPLMMVRPGLVTIADSYTFDMVGEGQDDGDKSVFKAITGAHKYALLQLLNISTGDDPEADDKTDQAGGGVLPKITDLQRFGLEQEIEMRGADLDKLLAFFQIKMLADLTLPDYQRALKLLERKK